MKDNNNYNSLDNQCTVGKIDGKDVILVDPKVKKPVYNQQLLCYYQMLKFKSKLVLLDISFDLFSLNSWNLNKIKLAKCKQVSQVVK